MNRLQHRYMRYRIPCIHQLICFMMLFSVHIGSYSQDLGQIGKAKLFKVSGGVTANAVYYEGLANRAPFTYFLSGNINLNISGLYTLPFSFSYSNQEFTSSQPFSFNRLSMHPSYKWVATHIGDVSMTFSPYTLSGHQFTGVGVDLTPPGAWKLSAMYGRLLKESEYTPDDPQSEPAYKRIGYGLKTQYTHDRFSVGVILFRAADDPTSITDPVPLELELQPKENIVASVESSVKLFDKGKLAITYASSLLTEDTNAAGAQEAGSPLSALITDNVSTQQYNAYNADFSYQLTATTSVGVGYEYIDPEYRTLGAYFFNNDLENMTVNASQTLFESKVTLGANAGLQRDDLDNTKSSQLQRVVSAFNATYTPTETINIAASYSNFQSFTNIKNQFDVINELAPTDVIDSLNFQQIAQNADLSANITLRDTDAQRRDLSIALSYQGAVNKQNDKVTENGVSDFYNANASYTLGYPARNLTIATAFNSSFATIGADNTLTLGPTVSLTKHYLDKKLKTTASVGYNQSRANGLKQSEVSNIRMSGNYTYKKQHNLTLNLLSQFKSGSSSTRDFTATLGYSYAFDKIDPKLNLSKKKKTKKQHKGLEDILHFTYRDSTYAGTIPEVNAQLASVAHHPHFDHIPQYKKEDLSAMRKAIAQYEDTKEYKAGAIEYLKELYSYEDYLKGYDALIFSILQELQADMQRLDYNFEQEFVKTQVTLAEHPLHSLSPQERSQSDAQSQASYAALSEQSEEALAKLIAHRWMLPQISSYSSLQKVQKPDPYLSQLMAQEKETLFRMKDTGVSPQKIEKYLIKQLIDFYWNTSKDHTDPDEFELKYTEEK